MKTEEAVALAKDIWRVRFLPHDDHLRLEQLVNEIKKRCEVDGDLLSVARSLAAEPYHGMNEGAKECKCSRCYIISKAREAIAKYE